MNRKFSIAFIVIAIMSLALAASPVFGGNGNGVIEDCSIDTCWANYGGDTGNNGNIKFSLVGGAPNGLYQAEVTGLTHATQVWNIALDADNPATFTR